jgi:PucR family transcriptional regulator, purine catabolism regulatory protein
MKVREVMSLHPMKGARVLAGKAGLGREVRGVNIIEVPDVRRWLRGGEFLFSAGFAWRDDPQELGDVLCELDEAHVSAIGLKLGSYLPRVPKQVLATADRLGFPLIRIPPDVAYMDIIDPIFQQLAAHRLWVLERTFDIGEVLASLGLDDQSLESVAGALARQLGNPVYVFDALDGTVLVASANGATRRRAETRVARDLRRAAAEGPSGAAGRHPAFVDLAKSRGLAASIVVGRRRQGRVIVVEERRPLDEVAERAVGHVAELLSFLFMKRLAVVEGRREASRLFLDSLLSDSLTPEEASERALSLGLRLSMPHVALVIGLRHHDPVGFGSLRDLLDRALAGHPHVSGVLPGGCQLLVLVEAADVGQPALEDLFNKGGHLAHRPGVGEILAGAGSPRPGVDGVRRSQAEATIAYKTAERLRDAGLVRFDQLGVERLLAQIPGNELTHEYIARVLGPLEQAPQLLQTLEVYLEHGGNKVAAAAAIPLHRSSLIYRLDKISRLLDVNLGDPERFLELWLAVRLRRMLAWLPV